MSGRPACCGVTLARREIKNSRTSARLSTSSTVRSVRVGWDALSVHVSTETPSPPFVGVSLVLGLRPPPDPGAGVWNRSKGGAVGFW
jgi:hypothetical protein